jgi:hypothetical protein
MKTCSRCHIEKDLSGFKKDPRYRLGVTGVCKECYKAYARANGAIQNWVEKNRDRSNSIKERYVKRNPEAVRESKRKWSQANPEKVLARVRAYQASKLNATPKWLTKKERREITQFYVNCPEGYEVDHIIPLRGKEVCGFHVLSNLQYLPISENRRKSNKVT